MAPTQVRALAPLLGGGVSFVLHGQVTLTLVCVVHSFNRHQPCLFETGWLAGLELGKWVSGRPGSCGNLPFSTLPVLGSQDHQL